MRIALLVILAALVAEAKPHKGRFERFCHRTANGRTHRGFLCGESLPAFAAFTSSGAGTFGACSTTPPTDSRGNALTFTRASSGTCRPLGMATSGITTASLVALTSNQPRVEPGVGSVLGLNVEPPRTNSLLRFIELGDVVWSDVGTPSLLTGQSSPWAATYTTSAVVVTDDDAAAYEGRQQAVTVVSGQPYFMHCYVRAATASSARITIDGTAQTITGLSGSTWSIIEVGDASASSASITVEVLVGSTVGVTGSVGFGGCQVEQGTFRTSMIPTTSAAVSRAEEVPRFPLTGMGGGDLVSMATTIDGFTGELTYSTPLHAQTAALGDRGIVLGANGLGITQMRCYAANDATMNFTTGVVNPSGTRAWCAASGTVSGQWGASMSASPSTSGTFSALTSLVIGQSPVAPSLTYVRGIFTDICVDPSPSRCR